MKDTIYRQAAIEAVEDIDWYHLNARGEMVSGANSAEHQAWYKADDIYKALEDLPSAQPEIIRCRDCKWWDKYGENHGYCMRVRRWGEYFCADAERREECQ